MEFTNKNGENGGFMGMTPGNLGIDVEFTNKNWIK